MSAILTVRNLIKTGLEADARLAGVNVYAHGGEFDLEALKAFSVRAPCVVFAPLSFEAALQGGQAVADVQWGMAAMATDDSAPASSVGGGRKWDHALWLADKACRALLYTFHGSASETVSKPREFQAMNEYSGALNSLGVAMWGTTWRQQIDLTDEDSGLTLDDLDTVYLTWDLSPRPDSDLDGTDDTPGEYPEAADNVDLT